LGINYHNFPTDFISSLQWVKAGDKHNEEETTRIILPHEATYRTKQGETKKHTHTIDFISSLQWVKAGDKHHLTN
jgi:hypothetical protein